MTFDSTTLYADRYLSKNKLTIRNFIKLEDQVMISDGLNQLKFYPGVVMNTAITLNQVVYYDISYEYTIIKSPSPMVDLPFVFDIGIAEENWIDNIEIFNGCNGRWDFLNVFEFFPFIDVTLLAIHRNIIPKQSTTWSSRAAGTYRRGSFVLLVDRVEHDITLFDMESKSLFYQFVNVTSDFELFPVFGMNNASIANVTLQLNDIYYIQG